MKRRLWLDSGAWTAHQQGTELTVPQLAAWLEKHHEYVSGYITLDKIPSSPQHVEAAAAESWDNTQQLIKLGFKKVIPVFHLGERFYWLERMVKEGFTHIGLGGFAKAKTGARKQWLDQVFTMLCGSKGFPAVKVHGFGMTTFSLMFAYPWDSVDSVSWRMCAAYGRILVPNGTDYFQPLDFTVSRGSKDAAARFDKKSHFDHAGPTVQRLVRTWCEEQGFDLAKLQTCDVARTLAVIRYFRLALESYQYRPFQGRRHGLFSVGPSLGGSDKPVGEFKIMFTIYPTAKHADLLEAEGVPDRLLSYSWFMKETPFDVKRYVQTGRMERINGRKRKTAAVP